LLIHFTILPIAIFIDDGMQLNDYVIANIITSLFMLLYFSVVRGNQYLQRYVQQKIELEKITNDQLQTELKFLKAQYHPHFLFNALNTIYFQMDENVAAAKKTIEKFSELLRYQLYDQHQTVPIKQELQYMQNFMDIQKIRTSEKLQLDTTIDTALQEQQVYPLLLLPLVENAFKYVGGAYEINIKARATKDGILFITENTLPTTPISEKANGIGLENLRRRLELLYPNRHELLIKKDKDHYHTSLQLIIQS
jgi:LytS/YehU family sensor histidine kinase